MYFNQNKIKSEVISVVSPSRQIAIDLHDILKVELDEMIQLYIIELLTEPFEWVNLLVTAEMLNRKLKDSLDLKDLNKTIKKLYYKFP